MSSGPSQAVGMAYRATLVLTPGEMVALDRDGLVA